LLVCCTGDLAFTRLTGAKATGAAAAGVASSSILQCSRASSSARGETLAGVVLTEERLRPEHRGVPASAACWASSHERLGFGA
jgi:hypothetical protein